MAPNALARSAGRVKVTASRDSADGASSAPNTPSPPAVRDVDARALTAGFHALAGAR
jgi:hypothetical protein